MDVEFCQIMSLLKYVFIRTSLVAYMVKHLPTMLETQVWSLGWEDPLEREMAIHFSTLAWKIPWTEEPGRLQSMGSQRVGQDWVTSLSLLSSLGLIHLLIWESLPGRHKAPGTPSGDRDVGDRGAGNSHFGELILSCCQGCWHGPVWNSPSSI